MCESVAKLEPLVTDEVERALDACFGEGVGTGAYLPQALLGDLRRDLVDRMLVELVHVIAAQFHEHRNKDAVRSRRGDTDCWESFLASVTEAGLAQVLEPAHAGALGRARSMIAQRARFLATALEHLQSDGHALAALGWPATATPLDGVRMHDSGSDPHDGQRTVIVFSVAGRRVVYKPRSLAVDLLTHQLFMAIERAAGRQMYDVPLCIDEGDHGWMRHVGYQPLVSEHERETYLLHIGELLGAAWLLRLTDLHAENVVSSGPWPVLVDAETLLQPALLTASDTSLGGDSDTFSVLDVHLLPDVEGRRERWWESSGLGGTARAETDAPQPAVKAAGSGQMTVVWTTQRLPDYAIHQGLLGDPHADAALLRQGFIEAVEAGIRAQGQLHRLLEAGVARGISRRVIVRSTSAYHRALLRCRSPRFSASPTLIRSELDFGVPSLEDEFGPMRRRIVDAEQDMLLKGDVPRFVSPLDRDELLAPGEAHTGALAATTSMLALAPVRARQESALIAAALQLRALNQRARVEGVPLHQEADARSGGLEVVRGAVRAMRRDGLLPDDPAGPMYGVEVGERPRLRRLGSGLQGGAVGIGMLLAALARVVPEEGLWAQACLGRLILRIQAGCTHDLRGRLGALEGFASALLGTDQIERTVPGTVPAPVTGVLALETARDLEKGLAAGGDLDLATGVAGSLAALSPHYRKVPAIRPAVERAVERLLGSQSPLGSWPGGAGNHLCGAAHGAAGIAAALAQSLHLQPPRHRPKVEKAIAAAISFERRAYLPRSDRWIDRRLPPSEQSQALNGWCHGAAGVLMTRLSLLETGALSTDDLVKDLTDAVVSLERHLPDNDRLCCGRAGVADALLTLTRHPTARENLDDEVLERAQTLLERHLSELAARIRGQSLDLEPAIGDPALQRFVPGMFRGSAGPLSVLLRLLDSGVPPSLPTGRVRGS